MAETPDPNRSSLGGRRASPRAATRQRGLFRGVPQFGVVGAIQGDMREARDRPTSGPLPAFPQALRRCIDDRTDVIAIDAHILEIVVIEPIQFVDRGDPEYLILAPVPTKNYIRTNEWCRPLK